MSTLPKFLLSLLVLGILGCLSVEDHLDLWKVEPQAKPSTSSRFYVLHDWGDTYSREEEVGAFPALKTSDMMLKTMGILRDGAGWSGVTLGNLFSRPHATALFVVDGISTTLNLNADKSFPVDQTGLSGCTSEDMAAVFNEDSVAQHMNDLFEGASFTASVSVDEEVALVASDGTHYTEQHQVSDVVKSLKAKSVRSTYELSTAVEYLNLKEKQDAAFLAEVVMIKQTLEVLKETKSYTSDGAPDVMIFTFSTLRGLEEKYGVGSDQVNAALVLVEETVEKVRDDLVELYGGNVLVQALVLQWEQPDISEVERTYELLKPFLAGQTQEQFAKELPHILIDPAEDDKLAACQDLQEMLHDSFKVDCFYGRLVKGSRRNRILRQLADENDEPSNVAEERSTLFSPIFLMVLSVMVFTGLALYAVSWAMWTMDPGRDTIIYRTVSDTTEGMRMQ